MTKATAKWQRRLASVLSPFVLLILSLLLPSAALGQPQPKVLFPNGGWCWFQDERAIVQDGVVLFASVKSPEGDVDIHAWDLDSSGVETHTLASGFESDDHAVAALLLLPDDRILAAWSGHGGQAIPEANRLAHWTRSTDPVNISNWEPARQLDVGRGTSYSNLHRLEAEDGRIYNFHRGIGFNPNYLVSDDDGATFRYGGRLLAWTKTDDPSKGTGTGGGRPYLKYASDGYSRIHFVTTEDHPRSYDNSLYHGYIEDGTVYDSYGTVVDALSETEESSIAPTDLSLVFRGDPDNVAWMADFHLDRGNYPCVVFSVQKNAAAHRELLHDPEDGKDHRYYFARLEGNRWEVNEIAYAGSRLYLGENDYTGLAAIDPNDPDRIYISTDADPVSGEPLISQADGQRHYEIFRGDSNDDGRSWDWSPVTRDSSSDNLRPIVPFGAEPSEGRVLLWLSGTYRTYRDYDLQVMGLLDGY